VTKEQVADFMSHVRYLSGYEVCKVQMQNDMIQTYLYRYFVTSVSQHFRQDVTYLLLYTVLLRS